MNFIRRMLSKLKRHKIYYLPYDGHLRWIPVTEALPTMFTPVLVYGKRYMPKERVSEKKKEYTTQIHVARRWSNTNEDRNSPDLKDWHWAADPYDYGFEEVTHWYPLPRVVNPYIHSCGMDYEMMQE